MANFAQFAELVNQQLTRMMLENTVLFRAEAPGLKDMYLKFFPEGTNPIFKERTEHDCSICKSFISHAGNVVAIQEDGTLQSVWDIEDAEYPYNEVAKSMAHYVKTSKIVGNFTVPDQFKKIGTKENHAIIDDKVFTFHHFWVNVDQKFINAPFVKADTVKLIRRTIEEIPENAFKLVLELINDGSLYRGSEYKRQIVIFLEIIEKYRKAKVKKNILWKLAADYDHAATHIRNSAIGTLLQDIADGKELDQAVSAYERVVAPTNYRRPKPLVTKTMVERAKKELQKAGYDKAIYRRAATADDIPINAIAWTKRSGLTDEDPFDAIMQETTKKQPDFKRLKTINIKDFIKTVLPTTQQIEIYFDNPNHLAALTAPLHEDAPNMFKWEPPIGWSYAGEVADSIKDRVEKAGGKTSGVMRISLAWDYVDDLDIHCKLRSSTGRLIRHWYYSTRDRDRYESGKLDVDMNVHGESTTPVENIIWTRQPKDGEYEIYVNNYTKRDYSASGFKVEFVYQGQHWLFNYPHSLRQSEKVPVAKFEIKNGVLRFKSKLNSENYVETVKKWNLTTGDFYDVESIILSPNYWQTKIGQLHFFFIIKNTKPDEPIRGFYNEYLKPEIVQYHKRTMEILGSKLKIQPESFNGLAGLGYVINNGHKVVVRVTTDSSKRMFNLTF